MEEERRLNFIVSKDVRSLIGTAAVEVVKRARRKAAQTALRKSLSRKKSSGAERAAERAVAEADGGS